ncbi:MAG: PEP-CTERM sorting domain-containing protein [Armatimonadota bacterium]
MRRGAIAAATLLVAATALAVSPAFAAFDVTVYQGFNTADTLSGSVGGEFQIVTTWGDYVDPAVYESSYLNHKAGYAGSGFREPDDFDFATFCVQRFEYLSYGGTYQANLSNQTNLGVPLDDGAAALYKLWYMGNLDGYDYGDETTGRETDAMYLQRLIWWRMGQLTDHGIDLDSSASDLGIAEGSKYEDWYNTAVDLSHMGDWGVKVMQLGSIADPHQDLLVLTVDGSVPNVPEPGTIALLATGGLGMLPLLRRRRTT